MSYTSETLGAFSAALGVVYSGAKAEGTSLLILPKTTMENSSNEMLQSADDSYLATLLLSHSSAPFPMEADRASGENIPAERSNIIRLSGLGLTPRECEVAFWISEGKRDSEIAVILGLAAKTVSKHVEHILEKLQVESRCSVASVVLDFLNRQS